MIVEKKKSSVDQALFLLCLCQCFVVWCLCFTCRLCTGIDYILKQEILENVAVLHQVVAGMRMMDGRSTYEWDSLLNDLSTFYEETMTCLEEQAEGMLVVNGAGSGSGSRCRLQYNASRGVGVHSQLELVSSFQRQPSSSSSSPSSSSSSSSSSSFSSLRTSRKTKEREETQEEEEEQQPQQPQEQQQEEQQEQDNSRSTSPASSIATAIQIKLDPNTSSSSSKSKKKNNKIILSPNNGDRVQIKMIGRQRRVVTVMEKVENVHFVFVSYKEWNQKHFNEYQPLSRIVVKKGNVISPGDACQVRWGSKGDLYLAQVESFQKNATFYRMRIVKDQPDWDRWIPEGKILKIVQSVASKNKSN